MKDVTKKRVILSLILFWFIPQVYVVINCLQKGPCSYDYKFGITSLILWDLLPSLFSDFFVVLAFLFVIFVSLIIAFLISTFAIREKRRF